MLRLYRRILLLVIISLTLFCSLRSGAVTFEEMLKLDAAYTVGSFIACQAELEGNGRDRQPMLIKVHGQVTDRAENVTRYNVRIQFISKQTSSISLTLSYRQTVTLEENGQIVHIEPDSLTVSMPGSSAINEGIVAKVFRDRFASEKNHESYKSTEITDFPSYIVRKPDEPPLYCHKDS
ncbi:hypothetical protein LVQ78_23930 [Buttiauxella sp. A2-C2_NF]|uniref:hypothetical protein n=1 Tax=Buttiauxella ferragutiae TaxID=82989 RepID=UPI001E29E71D|nr:hypothetical protein [Buttiauxella ferragutiae]MCE0829030.1 hypothetical protein [Buttiauxella ferragutiae]UNK63057.1 hypothetical protein MNO13_09125 [Buttiauxella ferragutiae]